MTVRVNKPAFNIREKLSELEKPIGMEGADLMRSETVQDARDSIRAGRKNLIINGDLRVWQRNTYSATLNSSTNSTFKTADRWSHYHSTGGAVTEARTTDVPPGQGFYYSLRHTVATADANMGTGDYHCHKYDIEGNDVSQLMWGTPYAKPITVSFWAKSSVSGDYGFCIRPGENNDRLYVDTITILQPNTWKKYSFTVPGCTDGTWDKGTGRGMQIQITHAMGTDYLTSSLRTWIGSLDVSPTTQVNWMETVGNTWYITGLQLEEGTIATDFDHRPYGDELRLCQRYYWQQENFLWLYSLDVNHGYVRCNIFYPVEMRAAPTVTGAFNIAGTSNGFQSITKKHTIPYLNGPGSNLVDINGAKFDAEF